MAFVIPTIYQATDRMTGVQNAIARSQSMMAGTFARTERAINGFNSASSSMVGVLSKVGAAAAIAFSGDVISDYESSLAGFRTIVSDLSDKEFSKYEAGIASVAYETKRSTIEIAQSYDKIAGLNATFAETAEGLGMVSKSAITLGKAARMGYGEAAESLVSIMNQFSFAADQSDRTINALAAGQAYGAASINQTALALANFGSTAAGANIQLEQSIALVQLLAHFGQAGADAGDKLKSSISLIQKAGLGYRSGQFVFTDALKDMRAKYDQLGTAMQKDAYIADIFGLNQITTGRILLTNIDLLEKYTQQGTGTSEAIRAAAINSDTLTNRLGELKNAWINLITTSTASNIGLTALKNTIVFVTDHMGALVAVSGTIIGVWAAMRAAIWLTRTALIAYNAMMVASSFITAAMAAPTAAWTYALYGLNSALNGAGGAVGAMTAFASATSTAFIALTAAYGVYKLISAELEKRKSIKELNPLGFDFDNNSNTRHNSRIMEKFHIDQSAFSAAQDYYHTMQRKALAPGEYYNTLGYKMKGLDWGNTVWAGAGAHDMPLQDSTDIKAFQHNVNSYRSGDTTTTIIHKQEFIIKDQNGNVLKTVGNDMMPNTTRTGTKTQ